MTINIPWTSPAAPAPAPTGLLNSPSLFPWLFAGVMITAALFLYPGQLWESAKALWAPVGRFLDSLRVTGLWDGLFVWAALSGAFLKHMQPCKWDNWPEEDEDTEEQLLRMAYRGFPERLQT